MILVVSALPKKKGTIPRWWWPVVTALAFGGSFLYWCGFMALQRHNPFVPGRSIGGTIGFEIIVHQEEDDDFPEKFAQLMVNARNDGSGRRVEYKVVCNQI